MFLKFLVWFFVFILFGYLVTGNWLGVVFALILLAGVRVVQDAWNGKG